MEDEVKRLERLIVREKVFQVKQEKDFNKLLVDYQESKAIISKLKRSIALIEEEYKMKRKDFEQERSHLLYFWNLSNLRYQKIQYLIKELLVYRNDLPVLVDNFSFARKRIRSLVQENDAQQAQILSLEVKFDRVQKINKSLQRSAVIRELRVKQLVKQAEQAMQERKDQEMRYSRLQQIVAPLVSNLLTSTERQYFLNGDKAVTESLKQRMRIRLELGDEEKTLQHLSKKVGSKFLATGLHLMTEELIFESKKMK